MVGPQIPLHAMCFIGYHLQNAEQILCLTRKKHIFLTNPYFTYPSISKVACLEAMQICHQKFPFRLFTLVTNISNSSALVTDWKVTKHFQINHQWKCILGSILCMFITQYLICGFHSRADKWQNIFDLYFMTSIRC